MGDNLFPLAWGALFGVGLTMELIALKRRRPGDTLSENVWRVFRVKDERSSPLTWALRGVLLVTLGWLTGHLGFGWWSF